MSNIEKYNQIYEELFGNEIRDIELKELCYGTIGWDSVMNMDLLDMIQEVFNISMNPLDKMNFDSYLSGIEILKKYNVF